MTPGQARWQAAGVAAVRARAAEDFRAYARSPYQRWQIKAAALAMGVSPRTINRRRAGLRKLRQETGS